MGDLNDADIARIMAAIGAVNLARNTRGQVGAALRQLPPKRQKLLACDFAEHAIDVLLERDPEQRQACMAAIESLRSFQNGEGDIREVDRLGKQAIGLGTIEEALPPVGSLDRRCLTTGRAGQILRLLMLCCCQRELEQAQLVIRNRYQPDALNVAVEACAAVARHHGEPHWDASDPVLRRAAQDRGRTASDAEASWQLSRILAVARSCGSA